MNSAKHDICAIIPAAGRGTRLGLNKPKILAPITETETIWTILYESLSAVSDQVHVVLSPSGKPLFQTHFGRLDTAKLPVSTSLQLEPKGMGDAIFGAYNFWKNYRTLLIVWGDQVNLSSETFNQVARNCGRPRTLVLPTTLMSPPYVQYDFVENRLSKVRMSREGHEMDAQGRSDIGLFALSVDGLIDSWREFLQQSSPGEQTGEINFLPFLPFLSQSGWRVINIDVPDVNEARGVNTVEDFEFAKQRRSRKSR